MTTLVDTKPAAEGTPSDPESQGNTSSSSSSSSPSEAMLPPTQTQSGADEEQGMRKRSTAATKKLSTSQSDSEELSDGYDPKSNSSKDPATPATPAPIPIIYQATKNPKSTLNAVYEAGRYKAGLPLDLLCIQSTMAGIYIAMAGHLFLAVGGGVLGAALFPTGLIAVTLTSAELFTGDALVFVASVLGKKVTIDKLLRNWTVAWTMNFVGSLLWAGLIAYASDALDDSGHTDLAIKIAIKKVNQPFIQIFLKAIGANFMVCLGVWQATCSEEVAGKILALWFPISAFVLMGFEHSIANQFFIPLGMMLGAYESGDILVGDLFRALAAATMGNAVGGGLMVGAVYWYVYDSMARSTRIFDNLRRNRHNTQQQRANTMLAAAAQQQQQSLQGAAPEIDDNDMPKHMSIYKGEMQIVDAV